MAGLLDSILGSDDPSTADPQTGLLQSQRRQLGFNSLGNIGAILLAAGENIMPQQRAQLLAQLGNVPTNTMEQQNALVQQGALNQRSLALKRQNQQQQQLQTLLQSPDFQAKFSGLPPPQKALVEAQMKAGDLNGVLGTLKEAFTATKPQMSGSSVMIPRPDGGYTISSTLVPGLSMSFGPDGKMEAQTAAPGAQTSSLPEWTQDLPQGVDVSKLASQPEEIRNRAIRVIKGLDPMPSTAGFGGKNPVNIAVSSAVNSAMPNFDPAQAKGAGDMIKRVATGDISNELTNFATVHDHAAELAQASHALNNGDLVAANKVLNTLGYQAGSTAKVVFDNIRNAYTHELQSVLAKGHITDKEVEMAGAGISSDMSPQQVTAAMAAGQKLMQDKINQRYATAYTAAGPRVDKYFERFGLKGGPPPSPQMPQQGAPAPAQSATPQQQTDPLEGRTATGPNGQKVIRRGGAWVPMQ
jgi:hypothetical protein